MSWWIGYARAGKEFRVACAIRRLGIKVRVVRRLDAKKVPTKRLPVPVRAPYLPNYLFLEMSDDQWHLVHAAQAAGHGPLRHLAPTMRLVPAALMDRPSVVADRDMEVRREIREMDGAVSGRLLAAHERVRVRQGDVIQPGGIGVFLDALDADYLARLRRHREGERIGRYVPGETIRILEGSLAGHLATFHRLVDASGFDRDVRLEADVGTIGGKPLRVRLDPLHVSRAKIAEAS